MKLFKNPRMRTLLALLPVGAALGLVLYYIFFPGEGYYHADCTDTLLWANASYESGQWISSDFFYAALLPMGGNLLMLPFLPLFGVSMMAHNLGMTLFALLFTAALWFLLRSLDFSKGWAGGLTALLLLLFSASDKLREIFWGHIIYYSLGALLVCLLLALVLRFLKGRRKALYLILLGAASFASALNGFQIISIVLLPIMGALVMERFLDRQQPLLRKENLPHFWLLGTMGCAALVGLGCMIFVLHGVRAGYGEAFSIFASLNEWLDNAKLFIPHWFSLLGLDIRAGEPIFSLAALLHMLRIFGGTVLLVVPLIAALRYRSIRRAALRVLLWTHLVVSSVILYGYICGRLSAANWRLIPLLFTAALTTLCFLAEWAREKKTAELPTRNRVAAIALAGMFVFSLANGIKIAVMPPDYGRDNEHHLLLAALEEENLTYGYASFWNSHPITVLSDSRVKVRNVKYTQDGVLRYPYQSSAAWYEDQPGVEEYFLALTLEEAETIKASSQYGELFVNRRRAFEAGNFVVWVYNYNPCQIV